MTAPPGGRGRRVEPPSSRFGPVANVTQGGVTSSYSGSISDPQHFNVTLPSGTFQTAGIAAITLSNPGTPPSSPAFLAINYHLPALSSLNPSTAPRGTSSLVVHALGNDFAPASYVRVNG